MSGAQEENKDELTQWVTFSLDDETYGIDVMRVQEVLRVTEITPVPGAKQCVLGIINLRGNVVTVIDTHQQLSLSPHVIDDNSRIIIVDINDNVMGLLVDSVAEVAYLHESEIDVAPSINAEENSHFIHGVHSNEGKLLILVDVNKLLGEDVAV